MLPEGRLNCVLVDYVSQSNVGELLKRLPRRKSLGTEPFPYMPVFV